ncbi:MAG: Gfo/Idh/MocA family oxidoreductase [Patescibacteria group bacterium]
MKFLICGLGSIGQRHYRNLKLLGQKDIIVFRTGKGQHDFIAEFISEFKPVVYTDLKTALSQKPCAVFVTNPTSQHLAVALRAAKAGSHLFIEKPLAHKLTGLGSLLSEIKRRNLVSYVAYNLRFHPLLAEVKEWLDNAQEFGRAVSVHASLGELVIDWHPWEDYRRSYACRKDLGGGVVLTQSHEIDYLRWLFGPIVSVNAVGGKLSDLDIDVDDVAKVLFKFKSGAVGSLDIDYLRRPPRRELEVITTKGVISWDYFGGRAEFKPISVGDNGIVITEPDGFERNTMYLLELENFLGCIQKNKQPQNSLDEGVDVLKIILAVKKSMIANGRTVMV